MQSRFKTSLGEPVSDVVGEEVILSDEIDVSERSEQSVKPKPSSPPPVRSNHRAAKSSSVAKPASRPKNIGRYKVIEELGRGAMAYVYKAYDPEIDRFLAVKVLREELANDEDYRSGFIHEAKLAGQLAHPGIVTVYDVGVADDKPYIAMELLDGIPMDELLKKRTRLPTNFVISILVQLTRALHYAHKQGVIHRDIKPGNIICLADNKTVKLTDFGIAQLDESLASVGKTQEKVLGTPEYMAPEQVLGQKLDARSDLYSLGTLLHTMLTGLTPFRADDYGELFRQIIKDKAPDLSVEGVTFPDELQDIVRKLLAKQPDKRYQNATELMRDIREMLEVLESNAKDQAKPGFVSLRLKWTLGMAGMVAITMLIGLVVVYYQQYHSMRNLAVDYGYSTSRLLAFEIAEPMLIQDHIAIEAIIDDLKKNKDLEYVSIRDSAGRIIASTLPKEIHQIFKPFANGELLDQSGGAKIFTREVTPEHRVLDIDSTITYQNKMLGSIWISVSADKLVQSTKLTLLIMIVLMMVTLIAVFSMTLAFARQISGQSKKLTMALERVRRGQFNRRLSVDRKDEFGQLSFTFNKMTEALEKRFENSNNRISGDTDQFLVTKPTGQELSAADKDDSTVILEKKNK